LIGGNHRPLYFSLASLAHFLTEVSWEQLPSQI
jgi:hypothetical protein